MRFIVQVDLHGIGGGAVVEGVDAAKHTAVVIAGVAIDRHAGVVTTVNRVIAQAAHKGVAAMFVQITAQHVIAITTVEQIVTQTTHDGVGAITALQGVVTCLIVVGVVGVIVDVIGGDVSPHAVITGSTNDQVIAVIAIQGVVASTTIDGVCSRTSPLQRVAVVIVVPIATPMNHVRTIAAEQGVIATTTPDDIVVSATIDVVGATVDDVE